MAIPETFADLGLAGYRHEGASLCRGCGVRIEWFWTPMNRKMPLSRKPGTETRYEPHHAVCPKAAEFRRKKR